MKVHLLKELKTTYCTSGNTNNFRYFITISPFPIYNINLQIHTKRYVNGIYAIFFVPTAIYFYSPQQSCTEQLGNLKVLLSTFRIIMSNT